MTSPSESQSPICVGLGNLPDKLLVKIFDHLPSQSDVVVCTAVCKHWFSLISTFFLDRTIHRHKVENVNTSFTFVIKSSGPGYVEGTSSNPLLKRTGRSQLLKFLSCYMPDEPFAIHPVASFKDLLLCHQRPLCESVYYLCNILTKQWFKLPRVLEDQEVELETMHGLICYPSFPCHHQNCTNLYSQYSYRVVRILLPRQNKSHQQFTVEIFCSVTGTWSKSVVSSPRPFTIKNNKNMVIVACDGIMYWMSDGKNREIVAYDPLNDIESCRVIESPDLGLEYRGSDVPEVEASLLGVTGGRLRLLRLVGYTLRVWELEDYNKQAKWTCQARIYPVGFLLLGFHPYDPDQVYLTIIGRVVALHLATKILHEATEFHHYDDGLTDEDGTVFQLVHPWLPTPVPPLQS